LETVVIVIMEFNKKETAYLCIFNRKSGNYPLKSLCLTECLCKKKRR